MGGQLWFNLLEALSFMYRWWVVLHMLVWLLQLKGEFIWDILLSLVPTFGEVLVCFMLYLVLFSLVMTGYIEIIECGVRISSFALFDQ